VREYGAKLRSEFALLLVVDDGPDHVGGKEIGRELNSCKLCADRLAKRSHGQRLGEAGDAFQKNVTSGEEADQDSFDHVRLTDDHLGDFGLDAIGECAFSRDNLIELTSVLHGHEKGSRRRPTTSDGEAQTSESEKRFPGMRALALRYFALDLIRMRARP